MNGIPVVQIEVTQGSQGFIAHVSYGGAYQIETSVFPTAREAMKDALDSILNSPDELDDWEEMFREESDEWEEAYHAETGE